MKIYRISVIVLALCLYAAFLQAIVVGSNTTVSKNAFVTFPARDQDNEMLGFASMSEGFALQNVKTSCIFGSQFPVQKRIELNGGTLTLKTDLKIQNVRNFTSLGAIRAEGDEARIVMLPLNLTTFGDLTQTATLENIELQLGGNTTLASSIEFEGVCKIVGEGKQLNLGETGEIIVASGSSLILQDVTLVNVANTNIRCFDDSACLLLNDVDWGQSDNSFFDRGSIIIDGIVTFMGTGTFVYESAYTSTINSDSEWAFRDGIMLRMGKHAISGAQPFEFIDDSSYMTLDNANLEVTDQGVILTKGKMRLDRTVYFEFKGTNTTTGAVLGTNNLEEDFILEFSPAVELHSLGGYFTYNNSQPNGIVSFAKTSQLTRSVGSNVFIAQDLIFSRMNVENESLLVPPLVVNTGKSVSYDDVRVTVPTVKFDVTGQQYNAGTILLPGNGLMSLEKGTMPLALLILSTDNVIRGNGIYAGPIVFGSPAATATWSLNGTLNSLVTLNNATLSLAKDLILDPSGSIVGPGTISLNQFAVSFAPVSGTWTTALNWNFGRLILNEAISINNTWTFSGNCEINGNGQLLSLLEAGEIVVEEDSSLLLRNLKLDKISGEKIRCVDDSGKIMLEDTILILENDYSFAYGALQFKHENILQGNNIFAYQTKMTSTLLGDTSLVLSQKITFSYDPNIDQEDLFEFIDESSELVLKNSTIYTTTVGMSFKKGSMIVENDSALSAEKIVIALTDEDSQLIDNGITFGDSSSSTNDFKVRVLPGVTLSLSQGSLNFRNLDSQAFSLLNSYATLFIDTLTSLKAYENISLPTGRIAFADRSILAIVSGKSFEASINPFGRLSRVSLTA